MTRPTIRKAQKEDMQAVLGLIRELAVYEKAGDQVEVTVETLEADGFGQRPAFECIVAEMDGQIVGAAIFYEKYSTWKGKCTYLEDLVVKESSRRHGIGRSLLESVVARATEKGSGRLEWQVLEWNTPAIEFYKKVGAELDPEWINCKFDRTKLINYFKG